MPQPLPRSQRQSTSICSSSSSQYRRTSSRSRRRRMARRSAIGPTQTAVYRHLHGDGPLTALAPVYDYVPAVTPFPYVQIGELIETPDNTEGEQGRDVTVTVFAWDQAPGFAGLELILDHLLRQLDEADIPAAPSQGWSIWQNRVVRDEVVRLPDGITRQLSVQVSVSTTRD